MRWKIQGFLSIALILAVIQTPARAANPKVSLKVENATAAEAANALSQASGIAVELASSPGGALVPAPDQKASFDWTGVPFARALRQLCEQYVLLPNRRGAGYTLYAGAAAAAPVKPVGLID